MTEVYSYERQMNTADPGAAALFMIRRALAKVRTTTLAQVQKVTNSGGVEPVGTLTILILVQQSDAAGNLIQAGTVYDVPYARLSGGKNAIIMDPQVGDIGIVGFGDRDLSKVLAAKGVAGPGSARRHHWSDALWISTLPLGVTPDQYIQFNADGISLVTPKQFQATAADGADNPPTLTMNSSGIVLSFGGHSITINSEGIEISGPVTGDNTATFDGEGTFNGGHTVSAHVHPGVTTGTSNTQTPQG